MDGKKTSEPFGKRLFDEGVVKKIRGAKGLRFWCTFLLIFILTITIEIMSVNRFDSHTRGFVFFELANSVSDKVIIPPLVVHFGSQEMLPADDFHYTPIRILGFVSSKNIPPGSETTAKLLMGATDGPVKAELTSPLMVDGSTVLDSGVVLLGRGQSSSDRLDIEFNRAVFQNGKFILVSGEAYDKSDSTLGIKGERAGSVALKIAAGSGLYFLSGMAAGLESSSYSQYGEMTMPSARNALLNGVAQSASENAQNYLQKIKNRHPKIVVKKGTEFIVEFGGGDN